MSAGHDDQVFTTWVSDLEERNVCVVCLCGELDVSTAPRFLSEMHAIIRRRKHVIMDVHLLEYADSTAVAAILSTKNVVEGMGRRFCFTGCHGVVAKVLDAIHASDEIDRFDDVGTALDRWPAD